MICLAATEKLTASMLRTTLINTRNHRTCHRVRVSIFPPLAANCTPTNLRWVEGMFPYKREDFFSLASALSVLLLLETHLSLQKRAEEVTFPSPRQKNLIMA